MRMTPPLTLSAVAALAIAGCTPSPYQTNPNQNANSGALYGAVIGGMAGGTAAKQNKLLGAAAGAVAGAIVGGAIGTSLDKQASDLRAQLANSGVTVINHGDYMIVRTPSDLLFATDSATVSAKFYSQLQTVAQSFIQYPNTTIEVVGHTDSTGDANYNMDLSRRRAQSVAAILVGDGVAPGRIRAVGVGETQPVATNATVLGREQNRRVEIIVRPVKN